MLAFVGAVLREFLSGRAELGGDEQRQSLRLLPICGGIFSGRFGPVLHAMTYTALGQAFAGLRSPSPPPLRLTQRGDSLG